MTPELVIFDCDGVLVDSEMIANSVLAEQLTQRGLKMTAADCRQHFTGISMASVRAKVERELGRPLEPEFEQTLRALDAQAFEKDLKAVPGIEETLEAIPVPVCLASSGSPEKIANSLRLTGLGRFFMGTIFSASMVANGKPAPDLFELAAKEMGVAPDRVVVIEDSASGVIAATLAHMRVFGFTGGSHALDDPDYRARLLKAGAERTYGTMSELPGLLGFNP